MRLRAILPLSGILLAGLVGIAAAQPVLSLPIACEVGRNCFVQNYVDVDPSQEAQDYRCGALTYNGHNGTDFRIPTVAAQRNGVEILTAAPGRVSRVRDGVEDVSARTKDPAAISGKECGNGLVIDHGDGWETQYCHMAQGSIRVRPGEDVSRGQPIGRVGISGLSEYPHLHFTVRYQGQVVDPFAIDRLGAPCGAQNKSLWEPRTAETLRYNPTAVLNAGFAHGPVSLDAVEAGNIVEPGRDAPALVAFVRAIGLKAGDVQSLRLRGPDGDVLADHRIEPLDRAKAQYLVIVGRHRPLDGWAPGSYEASYIVERAGSVAIQHRFGIQF